MRTYNSNNIDHLKDKARVWRAACGALSLASADAGSIHMYKNALSTEVVRLERRPGGAQISELRDLTNSTRMKRVYETGDPETGIWPLGIVVGLIKDCPSCAELLQRIEQEAEAHIQGM